MKILRHSGLAVALLAAATVGACASGGSSMLSQTDLTAEQLANSQYETVYDFLRAHSRARIISLRGNEFLTVYNRGGDIRSGTYSRPNPEFTGTGSGTEGQAAQASGTAEGEGGGEALLIVNDNQVTGNVTQILQGIPLSQVESLKILRPSETSARYGGDGRVGAVAIVMKGAGGY